MSSPINVTWTGDSFEPANRFWATKCDQRFVVGQAYTLDEVHARSTATHAHYFAALHDIWQSLPERMSEKFPTDEHLRKYALIRTGYRTETQHVCKTPAEAERLAAAIRPYDTYQIVTLNDLVVTVYNAISQDMRSMDKQTFQKSKESVLDFCSELVGIEPAETRRLAGMEPNTEASDAVPTSDVSEDVPSPDVPSQEPAGELPLSEPAGSDLFKMFNMSDVERVYLKEFAVKALDDADSDSDLPARQASLDRLFLNYRDVMETMDGNEALNALGVPLAAVVNGKRTREQAAGYIAREILDCRIDELDGRAA